MLLTTCPVWECFYDSPPPPKCMINLHFHYHPDEQVGPAKNIRMSEKRRGIGFKTVAVMGGCYRRNIHGDTYSKEYGSTG